MRALLRVGAVGCSHTAQGLSVLFVPLLKLFLGLKSDRRNGDEVLVVIRLGELMAASMATAGVTVSRYGTIHCFAAGAEV